MHPSAVDRFDPAVRSYLDTAGYGIPPMETVAAMSEAMSTWATGSADWINDWDVQGEQSRDLAAHLLGTVGANVALVPAVSVALATVLSGLDRGSEVVVAADEFSSLTLPAHAAARLSGGTVRRVPFDQLADAITSRTALVMTSHVRSNDGRAQDLRALAGHAHAAGAQILVDVTHSAGVLPVDMDANGLDFVVAAAYKHLLCPRGVAFLCVAPQHVERTLALSGSWRATQSPYGQFYGSDLSALAPTSRRFDVSLAWLSWVGANPSLRFLTGVPPDSRRRWCVGPADRLAELLGQAPTGSSVITAAVPDGAAARGALAAAGIRASGGAAAVRLSFHLYNDESAADAAADVLLSLNRRAAKTRAAVGS